MAEPWHVAVAPHNYNSTTVGLASTLQVSACMPNFLITEYFVNFEARGRELACTPFEVSNGYIALPTAPGLGIELDEAALARIAAGNLKSLIGYDEDELDDKGNIELRCWACAAGALGERKPDIVSMDPSWHHNYASVAWFGGGSTQHDLHYPSVEPELVGLTSALHALAHDASARAQFLADAKSFAARFPLSSQQSDALVVLDVPGIVEMGTHPLVAFLANMQVQRDRAQRQ